MNPKDFSAQVFDIQRASLVDGPGIRTTVFFYGCNLRCKWCHNPEGAFVQDSKLPCEYKPKRYTVSELLDIVCEDIPFYSTEGGVTCSGGECMLQSNFLEHFLKECKQRGIHTCIDTAGNVPFSKFEKVLPYTDLFLYDIKCKSAVLHHQFTGAGNRLIFRNLSALAAQGKKIIVRIPLIPEFNGNDEEMKKIKLFLQKVNLNNIEILPYHTLGEGKYKKLGLECRKFTVPSNETIQHFNTIMGVI